MILVTGAAGKTGRAVIQALAARGQPVRALIGRTEQAESVHAAGARETVAGDMRDPAVLDRAFRGAAAVYHICPNVSPDEASMGQAAIEAVQAAGAGLFVYHSVMHPQVEAMPHHWHKMRVEEALFASGLQYAILQPAAYMQNVTAQWSRIREGCYAVPYPISTRLSLVDLADVAEAAVTVLTEESHAGAIYELAGPEALSQEEVAQLFGAVLGRPVRAEETPLDLWEQRARQGGMGDYQVGTLLKMFEYYGRHGFCGNPHVLGWLLGREPGTLSAYVERTVHELRPAGGS